MTNFSSYNKSGGYHEYYFSITQPEWLYTMNSRWKNGQHLTYGGDGYNNSSTVPTNYAYSGKPWISSGWTELAPGYNLPPYSPEDRHSISSIPYFSLQSGQRKTIELSFGYGIDSATSGIGSNIPELISILNGAKSVWNTLNHNQGTLGSNFNCNVITSADEIIAGNRNINIYPNPSTGSFTIDSSEEILVLQVYDMQGRELVNQSINNRNKTTIDLSEYNNGFFVVRVQTKDKNWSTQKVAITK